MWKQWAAAPLTVDSNFMAMDYPYDSGRSWIYNERLFLQGKYIKLTLERPHHVFLEDQ